jgi:hypothetical protein
MGRAGQPLSACPRWASSQFPKPGYGFQQSNALPVLLSLLFPSFPPFMVLSPLLPSISTHRLFVPTNYQCYITGCYYFLLINNTTYYSNITNYFNKSIMYWKNIQFKLCISSSIMYFMLYNLYNA